LFGVTRDAANARLALDRGVSVHLATPNVTLDSYEPVPGVDGIMSVVETLDLLHRGFATLPVAGVAAEIPGALLAGVTSHVAERLRGGAGLPPDLAVPTPGPSVGAVFEQAHADGIGLRVLRGALPAEHGYPPEAAALLADALAEGWVAIVPERPVTLGDENRLGWWLVDPVTGETRDQMDDGRGTATVEWDAIIATAILTAGVLIALAACIGGRMNRLPVHLSVSYTLGSSVETLTAC
jgi:hypothetical protein